MKRTFSPLWILLVTMGGLWSGCDSEPGFPLPNQEPNTRISAGPPEAQDTGFSVNLFWFGWDDDGFVDHYEIAWESPDDWSDAIFGNDSLFIVAASETCCVDPLPDFGDPDDLRDSVYEQFHTFYVRAVDNNGVVDPTPAFRSFNAKTIAPYTEINFGPARDLGEWGTNVEFEWAGQDDDGLVVSYRYALVTMDDWREDKGIADRTTTPVGGSGELIAWLDTLNTLANGESPWVQTVEDSVVFDLVPTEPNNQIAVERYFFAVRATDNAGAEEKVLNVNDNTRLFVVRSNLDGPTITLTSNILGSWRSGDVAETREVFAGQGIRFEWRATPGRSQTPVAGFGFAVDDTTEWTPFSNNTVEWPEQPTDDDEEESLWFPEAGAHTFFIRSIDFGGFVNLVAAKLRVFDGPRFCDESQRIVLVVLDTDPGSLQNDSVWPAAFRQLERAQVSDFFSGFSFQIHETDGRFKPEISLLNCATSTFWFHSSDVANGDSSILQTYHQDPPNPLPSYVAAGGNLFLCGLQPSNALSWFDNLDLPEPQFQTHPLLFANTITDDQFSPHWAAVQLGIDRVNQTVPNTNPASLAALRLRKARSKIASYPDLQFDPLRWPQGMRQRGFGYYDRSVVPRRDVAETLYVFNETNIPIAVRRRSPDGPGINGNTIFVGFHPYFVDQPSAKKMIRAALADFGETPLEP